MAELAVLISMVDPKGLPGFFFHTFSMALYHKWDVKNDFAYLLQVFSFIFDGLSSVKWLRIQVTLYLSHTN